MKLGDVNNSWDPNIPKMGPVGEVQFAMDEHHSMPGDEVVVPVKVKDFKNFAGYQFTLSWDTDVLSLLEVNNNSANGNYGEDLISEGLLTTSWNDENGGTVTLDDDEIIFQLKFKVTGGNGSQSEIKIISEPTLSEAYNDNLDLLSITSANGIVKVGDGSAVIRRQSHHSAKSIHEHHQHHLQYSAG